MGVNFSQLKQFQKELENVQKNVPNFIEECCVEIAREFLDEVIRRTPNSNTNDLKKSWKCDFKVQKSGNNYIVTIENESEIASFIEYGHRTDNGFHEGHFMMTITEQQIQRKMDSIVQKKFNTFMKGVSK